MTHLAEITPHGLITYWLLSERTDRPTLVALAERLSLPMPPTREPATALRSALYSLHEDSRHLVRPLSERGMFALVEETVVEHGTGPALDYVMLLRASVDNQSGALTIELSPEADPDTSNQIRAAYAAECQGLPVASVAVWLCTILSKLHAVSLRDAGGVYWLPPDAEERWTQVVAGVEAAPTRGLGSRIYLLRTTLTASAVVAVHDALAREITTEAKRIQADIAGGRLKQRALEHRREQSAALVEKARHYEQILGQSLEGLRKLAETAAVQQAASGLAVLALPM